MLNQILKFGPRPSLLLLVAIIVATIIMITVNLCDPNFDLILTTTFTGRKYGRSLKHKDKTSRVLETLLKRETLKLPGLALRNGGRGLIHWLKQSMWPVRYGRKSTITICCAFAFRIHRYWKVNGARFVVLYLKASQICLMQAVAGCPVGDTLDLGCRVKRTKAGIPLAIPSLMRRQIKEGNNVVIRFWMTLFGLFRIIDFKGRLTTTTITDPPKAVDSPWVYRWIRFVMDYFLPSLSVFGVNISKPIRLSEPTPSYIGKSSPTSRWDWAEGPFHPEGILEDAKPSLVSTSLVSLWESSWRLANNKELYRDILSYLRLPVVNGRKLLTVLETFVSYPYPLSPDYKILALWFRMSVKGLKTFLLQTDKSFVFDKMVGRLGIKIEPAGKLRVFAFVDAWTQWILKPIHDWIFSILKRIPQDGTFNQVKPIELLFEIVKANPLKRFKAYSLDLSAATDRLPVWLQQILLSHDNLLGPEGAALWRRILVNRDYVLRVPKSVSKRINLIRLRYATGQPMGALSSWAMLALTHHAIVQYAAWRVSQRIVGGFVPFTWFKLYAVLGDDIIILNKAVATEYLYLMDLFGVKISLLKSLISTSGSVTLEFAKRFWHETIDVSMMPFKVVMVAKLDSSTIPEFAKKWALEFGSIARVLGYGYKVLGSLNNPIFRLNRRIAALLILLRLPTPLPDVYGKRDHTEAEVRKAKQDWIDWLSIKTVNNFHSVSCRAWCLVYLNIRHYIEKKVFPNQAKLNVDLSTRPDWFVDYSPKQRADTHLLYLFDMSFTKTGKLVSVPSALRDALRGIPKKSRLSGYPTLEKLALQLIEFLKSLFILKEDLSGTCYVTFSNYIEKNTWLYLVLDTLFTWPILWLWLLVRRQFPSSGVYGLGHPHDPGSFFLPVSKILADLDAGAFSGPDKLSIDDFDYYKYIQVPAPDDTDANLLPSWMNVVFSSSSKGNRSESKYDVLCSLLKNGHMDQRAFDQAVLELDEKDKPKMVTKRVKNRTITISDLSSHNDVKLFIHHGIFHMFEYCRMLDFSVSRAPLALNLMWRENEKALQDNVSILYRNWVSWTSPIWKEQNLVKVSKREAFLRSQREKRLRLSLVVYQPGYVIPWHPNLNLWGWFLTHVTVFKASKRKVQALRSTYEILNQNTPPFSISWYSLYLTIRWGCSLIKRVFILGILQLEIAVILLCLWDTGMSGKDLDWVISIPSTVEGEPQIPGLTTWVGIIGFIIAWGFVYTAFDIDVSDSVLRPLILPNIDSLSEELINSNLSDRLAYHQPTTFPRSPVFAHGYWE